MTFDLVFKNGRVIDGSGGPPFRADLGIIGAKIAALGNLDGAESRKTLDVIDRFVAPGFIDAHVHGDLALLADPVHLPSLKQGVTTLVIGQDGSAFAPASPATMDYMRRYNRRVQRQPAGPR